MKSEGKKERNNEIKKEHTRRKEERKKGSKADITTEIKQHDDLA